MIDVPRILTKSQIDKLGERLRATDEPSGPDLETLQALRELYVGPTETVQRSLIGLGLQRTTSRVKTDKTIVEKLRRVRTRLSTIQDLGGVRFWKDMTLDDQDDIVMRIAAAFPESKIDDLRNEPHFGYRAVHVIVWQDGLRIEVQVRSRLQQLWAEAMEKFADAWGRGLRYGERVRFSVAGEPVPEEEDPIAMLYRLSKSIAEHETGGGGGHFAKFHPGYDDWVRTTDTIPIPEPYLSELREAHKAVRESTEKLLLELADLPSAIESIEK